MVDSEHLDDVDFRERWKTLMRDDGEQLLASLTLLTPKHTHTVGEPRTELIEAIMRAEGWFKKSK